MVTPNPLLAAAQSRAAAFQQHFPKLDPSADSMRGLIEAFRRAASGGRAWARRPGQYLPVHTRASAPELKTIMDFAKRPDVVGVQVVPSSAAQRTPDLVVQQRGADGVVRPVRVEITTLTGAARGYQPVGDPGRTTTSGDIADAVRRKVLPSKGQSQLAVPLAGVPAGGTLVVHLPRGGASADANVQAAMARLAPDLFTAPHLQTVQFVLPGSIGVRYVRTPAGTYARVN
jgi:hypothetical protein